MPTRYYVMIKKKGSKSWLGAIPARRGITKTALQKTIRRQLKKGFSYKIITAKALAGYVKTTAKRRSPRKRKVKRRKTTRRKKRVVRRRKRKR